MSGTDLISPRGTSEGNSAAEVNTPGPLTISQLEMPSYHKRRSTLDPLPSPQEKTKPKKRRTKKKKHSDDVVKGEGGITEDLLRNANASQHEHQKEEDVTVEDPSLLTMRSRLDPIIRPQSDNLALNSIEGDPPFSTTGEPDMKKKRRKKKKREVQDRKEVSPEDVSKEERGKRENPQADGESSPENPLDPESSKLGVVRHPPVEGVQSPPLQLVPSPAPTAPPLPSPSTPETRPSSQIRHSPDIRTTPEARPSLPRDVNVEVRSPVTLTPDLTSTQDLSISYSSSVYPGQGERSGGSVDRVNGTPLTPPTIVGPEALVAPEDVVYNSQPTLGPMAAMFVSRSETEDTAVAKATGVTFVERRDGKGFRRERSEGAHNSSIGHNHDIEALHAWDRFYSSAYVAKFLHSAIQRVLVFLGGLLAGISLMDAVVVFVLSWQALGQAGLLQYYSLMSMPLLAVYQALFVLFLLSVTDRIDPSSWSKACLQMYYQSLSQFLLSAGWLLVLLAMLLTLGIVHIYEKIHLYPTRPDLWSDLASPISNETTVTSSNPLTHMLNGVQFVYTGETSTTVTLWQAIAVLRALLCCIAFLFITWIKNHDRLKAYLALREEQGEKETH